MKELRQRFGRLAYAGVVAGLAAGVFFSLLHLQRASVAILAATCGLLIAVPIVTVLFVVADEVRRRDWMFVALAAGVLALIAFTLAQRLFA